jgi:hypothetical protein
MTERDQCAFEDALRSDLAAARQQNMVLTDQLRAAEARNEAMAHRVDFLTQEVGRVTASREQYERVGIRASAMLESGTSMMIKLLQDLQDEIKSAAFAKVPGTVQNEPQPSLAAGQPILPADGPSLMTADEAIVAIEQIGRTFGAGFGDSASLLPPTRFGNGTLQS